MSIEQILAGTPPLVLTDTAAAGMVTKTSEEERSEVASKAPTLERLVRDHHAFVWRSAQRLGAPAADVEDVVQEVFIIASNKLESIRHERGFLFQTCTFVVGHARRRVQRRYEVVDEERIEAQADIAPSPEQSLEDAQARAVLQTILDTMPDELRAVFVLFELERLTVPEISEMIGAPQGTVSSRLRRAREMFTSRGPRIVRGVR
ncbi:RNA polymerase sigma factor RpoE [Labilithrix luteola]|uniref:RNA polymerase sigma factor RpoE n=1 Tax=Labilithrix luteola TaxID=1391654 RepID=A0A0K1PWC3_9BACT|nr:sigma-70 family RNA polymerase sigma factor [Labilithrix luteola]AKU97818.1 RNA polymerase sigma factor RpoE [Labilithrix luteola]